MKRASGILLPIFSLPSPYGIGCFSKEAREFIDQLEKAGQSYWQILPLGPTGYGDSPYQAFSTFAGNPYFIDPVTLVEEGLLTKKECDSCGLAEMAGPIEYEKVYNSRFPLLKKAFDRFVPDADYSQFVEDHAYWLDDYSLFMAIKDKHAGACWIAWEEPLKKHDAETLAVERVLLSHRVDFYRFLQYMFAKQWKALKTYANEKGIKIIGDIPIYVSLDSSDAWANPELFVFDEESIPTAVAGCPPDAFSATGQLWGNPLYQWEYHDKTGYAWWIRRLKHCFEIYDVVRIDHFRGFESYYSIPYGDKTAENGHWEKGPGMKLFRAVNEALGEREIIAEDLGYLTQEVLDLLKDSGYPGMKIMEFAFDPREAGNYLPHTYTNACVAYTGTHDNNTLMAWLDELDEDAISFMEAYMGISGHTKKEIVWDLIRLTMACVADLAVIPIQDYLCLGKEGRINQPSTLGNNWTFRMDNGVFTDDLAEKIKKMTALFER